MKIKAVCALIPILDLFLTVSRKDNHNLFGMAGGKVDVGETLQEALVREVLEETGLHVEVSLETPYVADIDKYEVYCYKAELVDKQHESIDEKETGLIRLSSASVLTDKETSPFYEYNIQALKHFGISQ